jgi:hypothetical protein
MHWGASTVKDTLLRLKGVLIAIVALALSASLTFGAQAPVGGWSAAGTFENNESTENVGDEETGEDENTDETTEDTSEDTGDNCTADPTTATPEELAAMTHGQIVCWAAQQTTWPEWFANHGKFVSCWAHQGKADAPSCTEAPVAGAPTAATHGKNANASTHSKGKGSPNHPSN